jgi:hypothetical protein
MKALEKAGFVLKRQNATSHVLLRHPHKKTYDSRFNTQQRAAALAFSRRSSRMPD